MNTLPYKIIQFIGNPVTRENLEGKTYWLQHVNVKYDKNVTRSVVFAETLEDLLKYQIGDTVEI